MASGMGIPFQPPMDMVQMDMQMVVHNPNDPAMVPQNMMPLQAVFSSESPGLVNDPRELGPIEAATAIRALIYRASTATDDAVRDAALAKARTVADDVLVDFSSSDVVEEAAAIAGLVSIAVADGNNSYLATAEVLFDTLSAEFDTTHGVFRSKAVYNVDDVAWLIGGLNFLTQRGSQASKAAAKDMLLAFYESTISVAGMQLSSSSW